jgi:hypothetical protein
LTILREMRDRRFESIGGSAAPGMVSARMVSAGAASSS